jgi:hypothetical protein
MADLLPRVERPVRTTAILFGVVATPFAVCTPFVHDAIPLPPLAFLTFGLAYCLLVVVFVIGLNLAAAGVRRRWICLWVLVPLFVEGFVFLWSLWFKSDPEGLLRTTPYLVLPSYIVMLTWLAAGGGMAIWGWIRYFRKSRSTLS